jgi:hypothetical protein
MESLEKEGVDGFSKFFSAIELAFKKLFLRYLA